MSTDKGGVRHVRKVLGFAKVQVLRAIAKGKERWNRGCDALERKFLWCQLMLRSRLSAVMEEPQRGSVTAEYAVILIAATGFAGVLALILKSPQVKAHLTALVTRGLKVA